MILAVQELQLNSRTAALVARNQVAELAKDVTTNLVSFNFFKIFVKADGESHLHHILMTSLCLQSLKHSLRCITLVDVI